MGAEKAVLNERADYFSNARSEMLPFVPRTAKRILEAGCGDGVFGARLKEDLGAEVWGIETDPEAGEAAEARLDRVLIGDLEALIDETPDGHFDCVIFNDVLEHLVDPIAVLEKTKRKLTEDGVVVCSIPNVRYVRVFVDYVFKKQWRREDYGIWDRTHLRWFTERSIAEMFDELGYDVLRLEGINANRSWKLAILNAVLFGALSDVKYLQFACVGRPR